MRRPLSLSLLLLGAALGCQPAAGPIPHYVAVERGGDRDGDGAADLDDICPDDPEDGLPPKANDGCPGTDPDGDGVLAGDDRCPDAKEDGDAPSAGDGCPASDADGDGVADARDGCPDKAEDNLAPDASDGCPAPDRDGDGLADSRDGCPSEPEARNGFRDDDGCPDAAPAEGVAHDADSGEIWVTDTRHVIFDPGTARLAGDSVVTVQRVAAILREKPEIERLEIEVHTTSLGDAKANAKLAQDRAQAVAQALVRERVEGHRLVPVGYGEYCPAVDHGDESAEPRNERVQFKTVVVRGVWQTHPRGCWRAKAAGIDPTTRRHGKPALVIRPSEGG